jgi:hypothetical protein
VAVVEVAIAGVVGVDAVSGVVADRPLVEVVWVGVGSVDSLVEVVAGSSANAMPEGTTRQKTMMTAAASRTGPRCHRFSSLTHTERNQRPTHRAATSPS